MSVVFRIASASSWATREYILPDGAGKRQKPCTISRMFPFQFDLSRLSSATAFEIIAPTLPGALGRMKARLDFNQTTTTTYNYDSLDRLLSKVPSSGTGHHPDRAAADDDRPERNNQLQPLRQP